MYEDAWAKSGKVGSVPLSVDFLFKKWRLLVHSESYLYTTFTAAYATKYFRFQRL